MTRDEAREFLEIATLLPAEERTDEMREALALTERDAELREWFEKRRVFDESVAAAVSEIEPPAALRAKLIQGMTREWRARGTSSALRWFALAASLLILGAITALVIHRGSADWKLEALAVIQRVNDGEVKLDQYSHDLPVMRDWLASV